MPAGQSRAWRARAFITAAATFGCALQPFATCASLICICLDLNALKPRVYDHLSDNWLELHLRFFSKPHGARNFRDEIAKLILDRFEQAGIQVASATYDLVGLPPLRLEGAALPRHDQNVVRTPISTRITIELSPSAQPGSDGSLLRSMK